MITKIKIIKNNLIKQHEQIRKSHLFDLIKEIKHDGFIRNPIIVDKNTMIILDGHHRFNAIKSIGLTSSPVYLVDYNNKKITVSAWRNGEKVTKKLVVEAGLSGKLLKPKTSKHYIPDSPLEINILLKNLI